MDFDTNQHSVFLLHYHLIMCIKYRNKVAVGSLKRSFLIFASLFGKKCSGLRATA